MPAPEFTCLKLKGLPYSVTLDNIHTFFQGYNIIADSVKIGKMADGKLTGEACVLFNTSDDCNAAHAALDHQNIGSRWVKLIRVQQHEYDNFENEQGAKYGGHGGGGHSGQGYGGYSSAGNDFYGARRGGGNFDQGYGGGGRGRGGRGGRGRGRGGRGGGGDDGGFYGGQDRFTSGGGSGGQAAGTVRLSDFVNDENRYRALKMRGLPFSVSVREIRDFFQDFRVAERDITIDMNQGRPTGYALVFFESEDEAQRAKDSLNKKYLGSRYVDISYPENR